MKVPARSDRACCAPPGYVTVAMSIVMGLIVLFRDRGVVLSSECLSRMGRLFSDAQGRISFRSKWLDIRTRDPSKEDLLRILKLPDLDALHYEVRYLSRYIDEEYLFKVPRKKKADEVLTVVSKGPRASPSKSYISEDVLNHQCIGRRRAEVLYSDFKLEMTKTLNDWNKEFVKVKYLQGEYKKKYDSKVKEMKVVEDQLERCIAELANKITSASSQNERMDRLHIELVEAQETIKQQGKTQQILEAENERLQSVLSEKEAQQLPSASAQRMASSGGFMKGVRTVHRKTGVEIKGLTPSQASSDASSDSGGEELESELQRAFALEENEDDVEIL
ncbi:hypothetical protein IEQ34_016747 [Dendrobium chrysotoxum]|uniref:Uncharacterized protein n=1 Tax=Dendrobium chrysotoxum TaxID=161865 RepID=A0AAV7GGI7_DENCH|nr:hypothetical protein IEQ34_016747 [Dendrobium chrysotoxum]